MYLVTLVTRTAEDKLATTTIGNYGNFQVALRAAKNASGSPRAKGESAGPGSFRVGGKVGTAYIGW